MSRSNASAVWNVFGQRDIENKAKCTLCDERVSCPKRGTSNLWSHLNKHHSRIFARLRNGSVESDSEIPIEMQNLNLSNSQPHEADLSTAQTINSSPSTIAKPPPKSNQSVLQLQKLNKDVVIHAIAYFIATDCLPYSIVESSGFRYLMRILHPSFEIPCRTTFSEYIFSKIFNETKQTLKNRLRTITCCSMTTDCWTSGVMEQYMSLTTHFVNDEWKLESYNLNCHHVPENHTSENLQSAFFDLLHDWNIDLHKVVAMTTDNGRNVVKAMELANVSRIPCFGHVVNLAVKKVFSDGIVNDILSRIKKVQSAIAHSAILRRDFHAKQSQLNLRKQMLPADIAVCWWSTLHLIERYVANRQALNCVLDEFQRGKLRNLSPANLSFEAIDILETLIEILKPIEIITTELSGDNYITSSCILPVFNQIFFELNNVVNENREVLQPISLFANISINEDDIHTNPKQHFRNLICLHFLETIQKYYSPKVTFTLLCKATILDPRFRLTYLDGFDSVTPVQTVIDSLIDEVNDNLVRTLRDENQTSSSPHPSPKRRKLNGLAAVLKRRTGEDQNLSPLDVVKKEFDNYNKLGCIEIEDDALNWWKLHCCNFPNLAKLAKKYLCIQVTSVPSERLFSTGGRVVTDARCSLTPEHVEEQIFLNMNRNLIIK